MPSIRDRLPAVRARAGRLVLLVVLCWLAAPAPARGHAALVSSVPEAGTQLAAAPGVVTVRLSEPLILDLSTLRVTDPDGRVWERTSAGERQMSASLDTTAQGVYLVEWKTVSPLDGHTLRGSFRFGVGVTPEQVDPTATVEPQGYDVLLALGRAVEYGALLLALGMLVVRRLARRDPPLLWTRLRVRPAVVAALVAGASVVTGEALLAARAATWPAVVQYLSAEPGVPRLVRLATEAAAVAAAWAGPGWLVAVALVGALAALASAGHAAAAEPASWGITVDAVHLVAAGVWAGGILAMATLRPPDGWGSRDARELLRRFTPVAIPAFIATVAFGTLRGTQELVGFGDLVGTSYGQVLLLKVVAVAFMVPLSWRAWRRRRARPRFEGALAVIAVGAAALLAAYPVPPRRAAEDAAVADAGESPAFPQQGDLTLARTTADVVVGLTLRPGRPGRNEALVHLLPVGGPEEAGDLTATLTVAGQERQLERCGIACRETTLVLAGRETVEVAVNGAEAEPATFRLPALPAPDAEPELRRMTAAMERLRSLRYEEVFGPTDPPIRSTAAMVAPDRMRFEVRTYHRVTIRIGDVLYRREGDGPWKVSRGPGLQVPSYIWDDPGKVAARVVAEDRLDGSRADVLSFFVLLGEDLPIWYRLWVDDEGLVHRAEMRAQGHFMDHTYSDFNAPITIEAPAEAPRAPEEEAT